jgi:putative oxidoreductase
MKRWFFYAGHHCAGQSLGLLLLRLSAGGMMLYGHGLPKWKDFSQLSSTFPDPIGLGSTFSLVLAIFAELVCSGLIILGIGTRITVLPLIVTMAVAAFLVPGQAPVFNMEDPSKELALVYLAAFLPLPFTGAGRYSLDGWLGVKPLGRE